MTRVRPGAGADQDSGAASISAGAAGAAGAVGASDAVADVGKLAVAVADADADAVGIEAEAKTETALEPPTATIDPQTLRTALGRFATGVTIVSCLDADGGFVGLTVNSFASLSLHPPLVLWSLRESSPNLTAFARATHFVVNVLAEAQADVSRRFAERNADKFDAGAWSAGTHGAPVLAGCAAVFECETVACQDAGDHRLFIGRVLAFGDAALPPLVYQGGHYRRLGAPL